MACFDSVGNALYVEILNDEGSYNAAGAWVDVTADSVVINPTGGDKSISQSNTFGRQITRLSRPSAKQLAYTVERSTTIYPNLGGSTLMEYLQSRYGGGQCFWIRWTFPSQFNADGTPNPQAGDERLALKCANTTWGFKGGDANGDGSVVKQYTFAVSAENEDVVA